MDPLPEPQYNQCSCALACFVWCIKRDGALDLTQSDFVHTNKHLYWEWHSNNREGLLSRGQLFDLIVGHFPKARKFVHTNSSTDFCDYINRNYQNGYICGFVMTRKPTNHCLSIVHWNGQSVKVMNPSGEGAFENVSWADFENQADADFLAFFK